MRRSQTTSLSTLADSLHRSLLLYIALLGRETNPTANAKSHLRFCVYIKNRVMQREATILVHVFHMISAGTLNVNYQASQRSLG